MEKKCPKCYTILKEQPIFKYGDGASNKIIGNELFCPNRKCDYQKVKK